MDGELQRILGQNVRVFRLRRGLTQEGLAEAWGWSRGYISELERGKRNVSLRTLEYLGRLTETSPLELLSAPSEQIAASECLSEC